MKTWMKPITEVQNFVANEYVAACWGIECKVANGFDGIGIGFHSEDNCGTKENQAIRDVAEGVFEIAEINQEGSNGPIRCKIYPNGFNGQGVDTITIDQVKALDGKTLYWTNTFRYITYYHQGKVEFIDSNRSNHS